MTLRPTAAIARNVSQDLRVSPRKRIEAPGHVGSQTIRDIYDRQVWPRRIPRNLRQRCAVLCNVSEEFAPGKDHAHGSDHPHGHSYEDHSTYIRPAPVVARLPYTRWLSAPSLHGQ